MAEGRKMQMLEPEKVVRQQYPVMDKKFVGFHRQMLKGMYGNYQDYGLCRIRLKPWRYKEGQAC